MNYSKFWISFLAVFALSYLWLVWDVRELQDQVSGETASPTAPHKFGSATSPNFVGNQLLYGTSVGLYNQATPYVRGSKSTCRVVDTTPFPVGHNGVIGYWGVAQFNVDGLDASSVCTTGDCTGWLESKVQLDTHGTCCIPGGSKCSQDGGGGLSSYTVDDEPDDAAAPAYGIYSQIVCNAAAGTASLVACCGGNSDCWTNGFISEAQNLAPTSSGSSSGGSSSGGSSSGSGGSSSGSSGGGSPDGGLVVSTVDFMSARGGESRVLSLPTMTLASSPTPTVLVDGVSATVTAFTHTSPPNTVTITTPASGVSTTNGNSAASVITVAQSGVTASTNGVYPNYEWYVPQQTAIDAGVAPYDWAVMLQNAAVDGGVVVSIPDESANAWTASPAIGATWATYGTNGGSGSNVPYMICSSTATNNAYAAASFVAPASGNGEWELAARLTTASPSGTPYLVGLGGSNNVILAGAASGTTLFQFNGAVANTVTLTANTDFYIDTLFSNTITPFLALNGSATATGGPGSNSPTTNGIWICSDGALDGFWQGRVYGVIWYSGTVSTTGRTNLGNYWTGKGL